MHRLARRPPLRPPRIGDIVKLSGPGGMGRQYEKVHGVGIITSVHKPEHARKLYEVKWLKNIFSNLIIQDELKEELNRKFDESHG